MLRSRFLWRLYAGYTFLILLTTGIVGGLIVRQVRIHSPKGMEDQLRSQASELREIARSRLDDEGLHAAVQAMGLDRSTRLTVILADGVVVADSEEDPSVMDHHGRRPEILDARSRGVGIVTRHSETLEQVMMYVALPILAEGELVGYARAAVPLTTMFNSVSNLTSAVAPGLAVAAVVALILGFFFARRITQPLLSMTTAAEAIAAGHYEQRVSLRSGLHGPDELSKLADAFNAMSERLHEQLETISSDRNKLTAILASMVEGVIAVDGEERVVHMNRVAGDLLEVEPQATLGQPIWQVTRITEVPAVLADSIKDSRPVNQVVHLPGERRDRVLELQASPLRDSRGTLRGAVLVLYDTTRLHRLERVRRDFVANVSHELKTPLTAIRGLVETLLDDASMEAETQRRFLHKVFHQAIRLSNIVTDLLSLSRLESDRDEMEKEPFDVRSPIHEALRALKPTWEGKRLEVHLELPDDALILRGNEESLHLAVNNLLDNAIKYTPPGGEVRVRLHCHEDRAILEVADSGIGIERQHHDRIFERFYRVDKARSRELGGTGLGLAIVKHTALAFGGEVTVDSNPGRGSRFCMVLPYREEEIGPLSSIAFGYEGELRSAAEH